MNIDIISLMALCLICLFAGMLLVHSFRKSSENKDENKDEFDCNRGLHDWSNYSIAEPFTDSNKKYTET